MLPAPLRAFYVLKGDIFLPIYTLKVIFTHHIYHEGTWTTLAFSQQGFTQLQPEQVLSATQLKTTVRLCLLGL